MFITCRICNTFLRKTSTYQQRISSTIHKCVCNVNAVPNLTQHTKADRYRVKVPKLGLVRNWSEMRISRICLPIACLVEERARLMRRPMDAEESPLQQELQRLLLQSVRRHSGRPRPTRIKALQPPAPITLNMDIRIGNRQYAVVGVLD